MEREREKQGKKRIAHTLQDPTRKRFSASDERQKPLSLTVAAEDAGRTAQRTSRVCRRWAKEMEVEKRAASRNTAGGRRNLGG